MKKTVEESVLEFHSKYGHKISTSPTTNLPDNIKDLRFLLIQEEYDELVSALGDDNLVKIADGAADLVYVIVGTCISYGIPFDRIFREVHNSNMTKTASKAYGGQKYGEVNPKGKDYIAPEINNILEHPKESTVLEVMGVK